MKHLYTSFLLSVLFFTLSITATAQKQTLVGFNFTSELAEAQYHPGIGATIEQKFTKHSGIESGLFYKAYNQGMTVTVTSANSVTILPLNITEHYLSIPILYKYYSRLVNVSVGPAFDLYTGFSQRDKTPMLVVNNYTLSPRLSIGALLKVSKAFNLTNKLVLEPELRLNPNFSYERTLAGLGIALKYKLH